MEADTFLEWIIIATFVAAVGIILYKLLTGGIDMTGLLRTRASDERIEPERIQLLMGSIAATAIYVSYVLSEAANAEDALQAFPEIPETAVLLLAGGNVLYLSGKIARTVFKGGE